MGRQASQIVLAPRSKVDRYSISSTRLLKSNQKIEDIFNALLVKPKKGTSKTKILTIALLRAAYNIR